MKKLLTLLFTIPTLAMAHGHAGYGYHGGGRGWHAPPVYHPYVYHPYVYRPYTYRPRTYGWVAPAIVAGAVVGTGAYVYSHQESAPIYPSLATYYGETPSSVIYYCPSNGMSFPQTTSCSDPWQIYPANPQ